VPLIRPVMVPAITLGTILDVQQPEHRLAGEQRRRTVRPEPISLFRSCIRRRSTFTATANGAALSIVIFFILARIQPYVS